MRLLLIVCIWVFYLGQALASEDDLYNFQWLDPDKKVYVLQNKIHRKDGTTYLFLGGLKALNSPFQDTYGVHLNGGHYLSEEFAVEVFYNRYSHSNNDNFENVKKINSSEPFVRRINQSYGAMAIWSPFYGKINTFNQVIYFDWYFGLGPAIFETESNINTVTDTTAPGRFDKKNHAGAASKTGLKIHLNPNMHLGIELFNSHYMAPGPTNKNKDKLRMQNDGVLSFGISF